jgi:hypothetical protein
MIVLPGLLHPLGHGSFHLLLVHAIAGVVLGRVRGEGDTLCTTQLRLREVVQLGGVKHVPELQADFKGRVVAQGFRGGGMVQPVDGAT